VSRQKFVSICCATLAAAVFVLPGRAAASGDAGEPPQSGLAARPALGSILYVPSQYPAIQAALDAASDGDEIRVADGTYTGPGNYDLDFHGKAVTLRSASGAPANCRINCAYEGRSFWFHSGETAASVVEGFRIYNGYPAAYTFDGRGGPVLAGFSSAPFGHTPEHILEPSRTVLYSDPLFYAFVRESSPGSGFDPQAPRVAGKGNPGVRADRLAQEISVGRSMNGSMTAVSGRGRATTSPLSRREKPAPEEPS